MKRDETNVEYPREKMKRDEEESCPGMCPYYLRDRGRGHVQCECARFRFPDRLSRREIVYRFCAHPDGYKTCVLKLAMDHYYERKYANGECATDKM